MHDLSTVYSDKGEGVKNPEILADVICTWPLTILSSFAVTEAIFPFSGKCGMDDSDEDDYRCRKGKKSADCFFHQQMCIHLFLWRLRDALRCSNILVDWQHSGNLFASGVHDYRKT